MMSRSKRYDPDEEEVPVRADDRRDQRRLKKRRDAQADDEKETNRGADRSK